MEEGDPIEFADAVYAHIRNTFAIIVCLECPHDDGDLNCECAYCMECWGDDDPDL